MIKNLKIQNIALIENIELDFSERLNILSGETGSGKSIIIDSICFLMGKKVEREFLRNNCEKGYVEALIYLNEDIIEEVKKLDIIENIDNYIIVSRTLFSSGRTINKLCGKTISLTTLKQLFSLLIDIHGQYEHQFLLNPNKHIDILDKFILEEVKILKKDLYEITKEYKNILIKIKKLSSENSEEKLKELNFQINDIEKYNLQENEEEELLNRKKIINNYKILYENSSEILKILYDDNGALDKIYNTVTLVNQISNIDNEQSNLLTNINNIYTNLTDFIHLINRYRDSLNYDDNEFDNIENRLNDIYYLKRKYGNNISEILEYYNRICKEVESINLEKNNLFQVYESKKKCEHKILEYCQKISELRKNCAMNLESKIKDSLNDLGMKNINFKVSIERKKEFTINGFDNVEFLISTNEGEPLTSLHKIASGGEMSRVMFAMKLILAENDYKDTFIFDEIDSGISGRTAQLLAEQLAFFALKKQIICITHLPQIAAMGDKHFLIYKKFNNNRNYTNVSNLDFDNSVNEIARLISGVQITKMAITSAREIKNMAISLKKRIDNNI